MSDRKLINSDYEIEGQGLVRQLGMWVRIKTSILGNFDTGPGLKNILTLLFIKVFGRPLFWLRTKLEGRHAVRARLAGALRGRGNSG